MRQLNWNRLKIALVLAALVGGALPRPILADEASDQKFRAQLTELLSRAEKSIQILREQITESQSEPFLADLYLQLAELLSQKSNALYYIQMEKGQTEKGQIEKGSVVSAQKEAIAVYEMILKEFPTFNRRVQVRYRLAVAFKAIDETAAFIRTAQGVIRDYPASNEALKTRSILGQHLQERGLLGEALQQFRAVSSAPLPYERNLARYRIGLVEISQEKYKDALASFERVILDPELQIQDVPGSVSLKNKEVKTDLKREALVDSIRAYTQVHAKNPDPVAYYQRIAPSELHFQEVMEKLALRYTYVKNYAAAVKLLRSLSERTADPQRIVNVYKQVLLMIPVSERAALSAAELRFVLEKYNLWSSTFEIPTAAREDSRAFFEQQLRELATRNHEMARAAKNSGKKTELLAQARDYYGLYLSWYESSPQAAKMASNLSAVYFALGDWVHSGEYAVRSASGEFGGIGGSERDSLLAGALTSLQKKTGEDFYETVRRRGLLMKTIELYAASSEKRKSDPALQFLLAKTRYEQGLFPEALDGLYAFAGRFRGSPQAAQAGELILDYFNVKGDSEGLAGWSAKLLSLRLSDRKFTNKLIAIETQSQSKRLEQRVKEVQGYDEFAQGQSYLRVALASSDGKLSQTALKEALARSRTERDLRTYLKTASLLGEREEKPEKRAEILASVVQENLRVGRFRAAQESLRRIYSDSVLPEAKRREALDQAVRLALSARDWEHLVFLSREPMWKTLPGRTRESIGREWLVALEAPVSLSEDVFAVFSRWSETEEGRLALYKARLKWSGRARTQVETQMATYCGEQGERAASSGVCGWIRLPQVDAERSRFEAKLRESAADVQGIQGVAVEFARLSQGYEALRFGRATREDAELQLAISIRQRRAYHVFTEYLSALAQANPDFADVLKGKVRESQAQERSALERCQKIESGLATQRGLCRSDREVALEEVLPSKGSVQVASMGEDPQNDSVTEIQRGLFAKESAEGRLALGQRYLESKHYRHAMALARQGLGEQKGQKKEFLALLGCSAWKLGYVQEAEYTIREGASSDCLGEFSKEGRRNR